MNNKNVALLGQHLTRWGGGIDFLRYCANALILISETKPINVWVLLPDDDHPLAKLKNVVRPYRNMARELLQLKKPRYFKSQPINKSLIIDSFNNINGSIKVAFYNGTQTGLLNCLREIRADVVLPALSSLGTSFPVPWIGYITDFQHKYYPQFFTKKECSMRDDQFARLLSESKVVITNSQNVKEDINKFYPDSKCTVLSLPFAPAPVEDWFEGDCAEIRAKYKLPARYFVICNQFWVHKSHMTAFEALLKVHCLTGQREIEIVCTGKTEDSRFPLYFRELQQKVAAMGLQDKIHFLGHIPKKDQIQIMRESIAVVQPTLFEGGPGGGAVYDAVATGVPAIVSDIPVNLEIQEPSVVFFKAGSADDLAHRMVELINLPKMRPEKAQLLSKSLMRVEMFGSTLLEAISLVIDSYKGIKNGL